MKKIPLSKVPDGALFQLSLKSVVTYTRIRKVKEGIVVQSNNSDRSYLKRGNVKVFLFQA